MSVEKYSQFISNQQKSLEMRGLAKNMGLQEAAIMKNFHGKDQRHDEGDEPGSAQSARANHEKIMNHLHKTLGTAHPVYKQVKKHLDRAAKEHEKADPHVWDNENKFQRHKEYAHGHEAAAKEVYADHLNSQRKSK